MRGGFGSSSTTTRSGTARPVVVAVLEYVLLVTLRGTKNLFVIGVLVFSSSFLPFRCDRRPPDLDRVWHCYVNTTCEQHEATDWIQVQGETECMQHTHLSI